MWGEVYLASFLSPNPATQSAADSRSGVPVAKLGKALSWVRGHVTYDFTVPVTSARLPDHTGQKQQEQKGRHFPILSLRVSNRKHNGRRPHRAFPSLPYNADSWLSLNPVPMKCLANELPCSRPHHKQKQQKHKGPLLCLPPPRAQLPEPSCSAARGHACGPCAHWAWW